MARKTSKGGAEKVLRYGHLSFNLNGGSHQLYIFQSPQLLNVPAYKDYLFLPFTDKTNASGTYGGGRYIYVSISEIKGNMLVIDFNKAYNPYCAYGSGFRCPIPPAENDLAMPVRAGEKSFISATH